MNEKLNTIINQLGVPAITIVGTLIPLITNPAKLAELPLGFLTSVLGNKFTEVELFNRLKYISPDKLNHDILRISKAAAELAVKATANSFSKKEKENFIKEICQQIEDLTNEDIVDYANELNNAQSQSVDLLSDKLKDVGSAFDYDAFKSKFQLYFGELLKQDHYAWVAYEREMQKMILNAVNDLQINLDEEKIASGIKNEIEAYINGLPAVVENSDMQAEIAKELREINSYFQAKKIIIKEIKPDKLLIEIPIEGIREIDNNYHKLRELMKEEDIYYFEYDGLYPMDELSKEAFNYLTGKIKYNQIFTKQLIETIKNDCYEKYEEFYNGIQNNSNWDTDDGICRSGKNIISSSFIGIIGDLLNKVFANDIYVPGETIDPPEIIQINFVKKCKYVIKRTLDLMIFALLAQLWDDVCSNKLTLADEDKIKKLGFSLILNMKNRLELLGRLIQIGERNKMNHSTLLLSEILATVDCFDKSSELFRSCTELDDLPKNPNLLHCYKTEKCLTLFLQKFHFFVNYRMISMKKIEYQNFKKMNTGYLHHYVTLAHNTESKEPVEKSRYNECNDSSHSVFTNAVLLYNGDDYTQNINLFPFVIDDNALKMVGSSRIAFFRKYALENGKLEYTFLKDGSNLFLENKHILQKKKNEKDVYLSDEDIKIYNVDCVVETFHKIQKTLFI
jgi:hypothetical protein